MMKKLMEWFRKGSLSGETWEEKFKNRLFFLLVSLTIPSFLIFGIIHIFDRNTSEIVSNFLTAIILSFLLIVFLYTKKQVIIFLISSLLITVSISFLFYLGGDHGSRILWFYFIPVTVFFLLGIRNAIYFVIFSYIIIGVVFIGIPILGFLPYSYEPEIKTRFIITFSLIVLFGGIYAYIQDKFRLELKNENEKLKEANYKIHLLSITDPLTQCYNRNYFNEIIEKEINRTQRYPGALSLVMCDIDFFKKCNDSYGHAAGDAILIQFSRILLDAVRKKIDDVFRVGGEEFVIILPQTDTDGAAILANRIHQIVRNQKYLFNELTLHITASFGVITLKPSHPQPVTVDSLLIAVDRCLYAAKNNGRDQVISEIYGSM